MAETAVPRLLSVSDAPKIASYSLYDPKHPEVEIGQAEHRIDLVNHWNIAPGSRVLEIGCGQGNATAVLAEVVGESGSIDAIDPAPSDYGAPFTLAQAQAHLSASPIGRRITWHQATPEDFLAQAQAPPDGSGKTWDVAVLSHCIWYFASPAVLGAVLGALRGRAARLCVAEYALQATERAAEPHVLATLATGMLESHKAESSANIQSPLGPRAIAEVAKAAGWTLRQQREGEGEGEGAMVVPRPGLLDGRWETLSVVDEEFIREMEEHITDERVKLVLRTARDATIASVRGLGGEPPRTMDVWVASFD